MIQKLDMNGSGQIDYREFISVFIDKERILGKKNIAQAFSILDRVRKSDKI